MGLSKRLASNALEPVLGDGGNWIRAYLQVPCVTRRGDEVSYRGRVLKPQADTGSLLEFACNTTALRRARVRIPVCVKTETVAKVFVNGELARQTVFTPVAGDQYTLRILVLDVTRWTEGRAATRLQLQLSSNSQSDSLFIPLSEDQPHCRPIVLQRRGARYSLTSGLFFLLAWANVLTIAFLTLATFSKDRDQTLRNYAVLITALVWLTSLLGLPDLAKIPVRSWIRRLFAATQPIGHGWRVRRRELVTAALAIVLGASVFASKPVATGYWHRDRYTRLIKQGLQSLNTNQPAIEAFKLEPWRKEAQILLERSAFLSRPAGTADTFRSVAAELASTLGVEAAILSQPLLPLYLQPDILAVANPMAWYASFLIEGDSVDDGPLARQARNFLSTSDPESALILAYLDMTDSSIEVEEQERRAKALGDRLERVGPKDLELLLSHSYLWASDTLAMYHLAYCDQEAASYWLAKELKARLDYAGQVLWLRPPEKFGAFYLFGEHGGMTDAGILPGSLGAKRAQLADSNERCGFDFRPVIKKMSGEYSVFKTREGWVNGTIYEYIGNSQLEELLESLLTKGWRY